jgi:hypothetical protein
MDESKHLHVIKDEPPKGGVQCKPNEKSDPKRPSP